MKPGMIERPSTEMLFFRDKTCQQKGSGRRANEACVKKNESITVSYPQRTRCTIQWNSWFSILSSLSSSHLSPTLIWVHFLSLSLQIILCPEKLIRVPAAPWSRFSCHTRHPYWLNAKLKRQANYTSVAYGKTSLHYKDFNVDLPNFLQSPAPLYITVQLC